MTKNPYRRAKRILTKIGNGILYAICGLAFASVLFLITALCLEEGWGWWTLLLIPGIPAGLIAIGASAALFWWVVGTIEDKWRDAENRWERENRQTVPTSVLLSGGTSSDAGES
jgi:hypothetical protein